MTKPKATFQTKLHLFVYSGFVLFFFILRYPELWFYVKKPELYYSKLVKLRKWIASTSAFYSRFSFNIEEHVPTDWSRNYVICANHSSNLDITAVMMACKSDFSFMGKSELLHNPVTGLFFKSIDIPVNRESKLSSFKAFKRAQALLKDQKSIVIFPEGGIDDHFPPQLGDFKSGSFRLALDAGVPILPIVIHDSWKLFWDDGAAYGTRTGVCHVSILPAIETVPFSDAESLSIEVFNRIQDTLLTHSCNKLSKEDSKK